MSEPSSASVAGARLAELDLEARVGAGIAAAALAAAALGQFGVGARGLIAAILCGALVVATAFDLEQRRIPNLVVVPAFGLILLAQLAFFPGHALEWIGAALGAGLVLFVPTLIRRDAIGAGDVKLAMLLGAGLGGDVIVALLISSLASAPVALWILIKGGSAARGTTIPLGPFLALGGIVALFLGTPPS